MRGLRAMEASPPTKCASVENLLARPSRSNGGGESGAASRPQVQLFSMIPSTASRLTNATGVGRFNGIPRLGRSTLDIEHYRVTGLPIATSCHAFAMRSLGSQEVLMFVFTRSPPAR